jgi:hypothetical protein
VGRPFTRVLSLSTRYRISTDSPRSWTMTKQIPLDALTPGQYTGIVTKASHRASEASKSASRAIAAENASERIDF